MSLTPDRLARRIARRGVPRHELNRPTSRLAKVGLGLVGMVLVIVLMPILGEVLLVVLLLWPAVILRNWLRMRRFARKHAGQSFLIVSRRHGWHELIRNNVIPALPSEVVCVWSDHDSSGHELLRGFIRRNRWAGKRPYLVNVSARGLAMVPLHERLRDFKRSSRRDSSIQQQIGEIVAAASAAK